MPQPMACRGAEHESATTRRLAVLLTTVGLISGFSERTVTAQGIDPSPYALVGTATQAGGPVAWPDGAPAETKLERILEAWAMDDGFAGAVIATRASKTVLARGFGMASYEHGVPNTAATRFPTGYLARQFTAALIGRLADRGLVELDRTVGEYVPITGPASRPTLRQLLANVSGLQQNLFLYTDKSPADAFVDLRELLDAASQAEMLAEPGQSYEFSGPEGSSVDGILLAAVIEHVAGTPLSVAMRREVLEPLGMMDTGFLHPRATVKGLAAPYMRLFGRLEPYPSTDYSYLPGAGDMFSTVADLERFFRLVLAERALGEAVREAVRASLGPIEFSVVDGALVRDAGDAGKAPRHRYVDSNGWMRGSSILLSYYPERGDLLVVLSNVHRGAQVYDIRRRWTRLLFDLPVGLPLPKMRKSFWQLALSADPGGAAARYRELAGTAGGADLPLRDEIMFHIRELRRRGALDQALAIADVYVALEPDFWLAHWEMGEVLRARDAHEAAQNAYLRALQLDVPLGRERQFMEQFLARFSPPEQET